MASKYKYCQTVDIGKGPDGRRKQKRFYGNTKAELSRNISEYMDMIDIGLHPDEISFGAYSKKWLEAYKATKALNTQRQYELDLKHCSELDPIRVKDIQRTDLQRIINENKEYPTTCKNIRMTLRQIFRSAVQDGIILKNTADGLEIPKSVPKEKRALTDKEIKALKKLDNLAEMDHAFVIVLYYFGLRPGEALALQGKDFDFAEGILTVSKSVAFDGNNPVVKSTKTNNIRHLPIPGPAATFLKKYVTGLDRFQLFVRHDGQLMSAMGYRRMWERIKSEINLQMGGTENICLCSDLTPYIFRHNYATQLYYSGITMKKAAQLMGHTNTQMIMRVYAHLDDEREDLSQIFKADKAI